MESRRTVMAAMPPFLDGESLSPMMSSALGGHRKTVWSGDRWLSPGAENVSSSVGAVWGGERRE